MQIGSVCRGALQFSFSECPHDLNHFDEAVCSLWGIYSRQAVVPAHCPLCWLHCDWSARSCFTYSCKEPGCLPAVFIHAPWISLCVCMCVCVCVLLATIPLSLGTHWVSFAYQQATHTHTHCQGSCSCHALWAYFWVSSCRVSLTCEHGRNHTTWQRVISCSLVFCEGEAESSGFLLFVHFSSGPVRCALL